jgi:hypothetical protein
MALKLNEARPTREAYKEFYGRNTEQMPKLIADDRVPMNVSQLMQRRLNTQNSDADVKSSYLDNWFDTGDAVVYHPGGRVKIVLDSQDLRDITSDSQLRSGALVLTEDIYNNLQGEEFKKGKLGKVDEWLSREAVKSHPVWKVLARDQGLLNDYADYIFAEGKQRFGNDEAMRIFPSSAQGNTPELRAWCVGRLVIRSNADGWLVLDDVVGFGRFVGIAPEALSAPSKGASNIKAYTMADLQAVDKAMKGLEGVLNPELLKPFLQLRKKL